MIKIGEVVKIKSNELYDTKKLFGLNCTMKKMRGRKYIVRSITVKKDGVKLNGYWFSNDDICDKNIAENKIEKIFKFNEDELF